ncbi:MAG: NTP transferase domain-containing protein [Thermoguttaceae bacterium]|nr:NTP transferase domain-containing protein [Thermoguttaceae bacterium]
MSKPLSQTVRLSSDKTRPAVGLHSKLDPGCPVLLMLAAGKGTRFGTDPKCIAPVLGRPLARHSIDAFHSAAPGGRAAVVIGYRHEEVAAALGGDNHYIVSENPTGGTAWAVFEAFSLAELLQENPIVVVTMGDRVVPEEIFRRILAVHRGDQPCETPADGREADLTLLTALYDAARLPGKGRIVRDGDKKIIRIVEERDIRALTEVPGDTPLVQNALLSISEGNCPLYVLRARTLFDLLKDLTNDNAQNQYYLTDIIEHLAQRGGIIRSVTLRHGDPTFEILCADVTRADDIPRLERALENRHHAWRQLMTAAEMLRAGRPAGQTASIRRQLQELLDAIAQNNWAFDEDRPVAIGVSGGRFRIAFMHPDMGRFYGPAWQVPIGAAEESGTEQITLLTQEASDGRLHLYPLAERFRESVDFIEADRDEMFPGEDISDWYRYEEFGTNMSRRVLLSLGYFSDEELAARRAADLPLPPESLWASTNMRRPFSLVSNAIASLRTWHQGLAGERITKRIGRGNFTGLILTSTGLMPQGGFSCSSALTIAVKNALNALYDLSLTGEELIHLAAQAEYGTGVRAGALDQATVQKGEVGKGTLISSNPRDHYAVLGTFPVPDNIQVIFPYSAARDTDALRYCARFYAAEETGTSGRLTPTETRKLTGKAAELAAILLRQPLDVDLFDEIKDELLRRGELSEPTRRMVCDKLLKIPLLIGKAQLRERVASELPFFTDEIARCQELPFDQAEAKARRTIDSLFKGWRDPVFSYWENGAVIQRAGIPLRAMVAYLYAETAKNFYLIHHTDQWTKWVAASQRGDACFQIDPDTLPEAADLMVLQPFEQGAAGCERVDLWLEKFGARPFDFNAGIDDQSLKSQPAPRLRDLPGGNFFRGLAVVDLAEAFLRRAFGTAVAVRVNAAGQGDFFQVHIDTGRVRVKDVERFLQKAYYQRFDIHPEIPFITVTPGGGAVGVRLDRLSHLPRLIEMLQ